MIWIVQLVQKLEQDWKSRRKICIINAVVSSLQLLHFSSLCQKLRNDLRDVVQWRVGGLALLFPHLASLPLPVDRLPFLAWNHVSTELFIASNGSELSPAQLNRTWRIICGQQQKRLCSPTSSTVAVFTFCPSPSPSGEDEVYPQDWLRARFELRNMLWWLLLSLSSQEAGFTGFMRSLRGRDQEKVVKRKEELWEKHAGRGWGAMHCDPWAWQRALSALTGETRRPKRKAIFLYRGDSVCNNTRVLAVRPTTRDFFTDVLMGRKYTDEEKKKRKKKGFLVFAQPLWLNMWKATPYTVSMQYCPMLSSAGVCVTVRPPWWWTGGGHQYLTVEVALSQWVLIQPHQPCSVSKRDKCWLLTYTFWFQWFGVFLAFFLFVLLVLVVVQNLHVCRTIWNIDYFFTSFGK